MFELILFLFRIAKALDLQRRRIGRAVSLVSHNKNRNCELKLHHNRRPIRLIRKAFVIMT
ncbi:hypothetical protein C5167_043674 [Papaver somniferum]|uniref:Uncharacterized protein n=1 Tax=Papaver somniferum TaxID=3469 RepID=A0A4Y7LA85_PAPSO|nr:hypothetical protein C5167_043674 [Papaver somniferum]